MTFPTTPTALYRVANKPIVASMTIADVVHHLGFSKFLEHAQEHPYFTTLPIRNGASTQLNVWNLIRVTIPVSPYSHKEQVRRIHSHSGLDKAKPQQWDPLFYVSTYSDIEVRTPQQEVIYDYSVGRIALLFALKPSEDVLEPCLMAYVQRFSDIPKNSTGTTGFYTIGRLNRYEVIAASQIARPCSLSPQIKGVATRDIEGHQSLNHYKRFYINKYRLPIDFLFIHSS
ncbi:hypothetical protein FRC08_008149 [Ceratobasidium sp. 394]|nr:hypothetical protein FRC08_008149 [Ceratobasidium sp. 394]